MLKLKQLRWHNDWILVGVMDSEQHLWWQSLGGVIPPVLTGTFPNWPNLGKARKVKVQFNSVLSHNLSLQPPDCNSRLPIHHQLSDLYSGLTWPLVVVLVQWSRHLSSLYHTHRSFDIRSLSNESHESSETAGKFEMYKSCFPWL